MTNNSMWYSPYRLLSYNAFINMCLSGRGMGKTYSCKKFIVKRFKKTGKQTVYLRRTKTELDKATKNFWGKLVKNNEFPEDELTVSGDTGFVNGEPVVHFVALSTASTNRSVEYPDVDLILFDEYIIESSTYTRYLKNEVNLLLSLCETIFRDRDDARVLLMSNSISYVNPLFNEFQLRPKEGKQFNLFMDGLICVEIYENKIFTEHKKKTKLARLMNNTKYGDYAINNKLLEDDEDFIIPKRPAGNWAFVSSFYSEGFEIGVWIDNDTRIMYVDEKIDPSNPNNYVLTVDDHKDGYRQVSEYRGTTWRIKDVKKAFNNGILYFENQRIKKFVQEKLMRWI